MDREKNKIISIFMLEPGPDCVPISNMVPIVMVVSIPVPVVNSSTLVTAEEYLSMCSNICWSDSLSNLIVESTKENTPKMCHNEE